MKYFFILGNNPALSLAELDSILGGVAQAKIYNKIVLVMDIDKEINTQNLISRLGGVIKIGIVQTEKLALYSSQMSATIKKMLGTKEGKYKFGISNYNKFASLSKDKRIAMNIKKYLKEQGQSCRWVVGRKQVLSSVIVEQNLMQGRGMEIIIAGDYKSSLVGRTLAVQPFKYLAARDYGRPSRDDYSGMLPPKLAQIMVNLAGIQKNDVLLDPFCGSGTVISEAMAMGYQNIIGSDLSSKAIMDSKNNIAWLSRKFDISTKVKVFKSDVRDLLINIKSNTIKAIVTEPYLGPQRGRVDQLELQKELNELYSQAIKIFNKVLIKNAKVIMIWPVRNWHNKQIFLSPNLANFKRLTLLGKEQRQMYKNNFSYRNNIIYGRIGQKVWREIVVLEKK